MAVQNDDTAETTQPDAVAGEEKKGKGFILILVPVLLLSLAAGGYLAYSQYSKLTQAAAVIGQDFGSEEEQDNTEPVEYGEFTELQGLIINPSGTEGRRYLMVNVGLETGNAKVLEELEQKDIVVRDKILQLLSLRTVPELSDIALREEIKEQLLTEVNSVLEEDRVTRLYFTQYVLQ